MRGVFGITVHLYCEIPRCIGYRSEKEELLHAIQFKRKQLTLIRSTLDSAHVQSRRERCHSLQ
ncbi:Uncharacterised protein [Vibrio cholerae]|uniref:Uncharacterized protein n=1 Tax=Vibrio cholerae TaxID=666 RepID=A0A655WI88_VIBCL|nr:Uncharacterised protein [Vibrio cholerae]